ncbi:MULTISPECIES: TnsA endonuclease N-terminal domain-containing protein [Enterobacter cloacae complex]|uniref:TnsA endonuclease N-terminal domain-containing protein n=2 Tax=Enterobacterales TaxID=91347 RepID=UPI00220AF7E0|nr:MULTISPECIES: TnsA endonuclease C-terminal domain-containing protein [Enterobacter cloacae complex]CAH8250174.1 Transposon Tn7 transposition protein TnsA [Enterobacter ludwigii]
MSQWLGGFFMAGKKYVNTELQSQKWLREGRGSGHGSDYKPWLTVRDLSSQGRSHRVFGHKSQRTHHLLSDLELAVFLLLEWSRSTVDIREQFPLRLEDTKALALESGIGHPSVRGVLQVMSSDFLVNTTSASQPKFALQAKYAEALSDARTIEKLELERRYWLQKGVPWWLITEKDIPGVVTQNISWLYPAQRDEIEIDVLMERAAFYQHHFQNAPRRSVIEVAKQLDTAYQQPIGQSLLEIRQLLAQRCFLFDILTPVTKLKAGDLQLENIEAMSGALRVSNQ